LFYSYGPSEDVMVDGQVRPMKAQAVQNEARIQPVRVDMQQPAGFGAGGATRRGPEPAGERVDMPAGTVVVCEPYDAGGGFTCFEWFPDGRVKSVWSSEDLSGGYPRPLNMDGLLGSRSATRLQDRLDTYLTYLLIVVLPVLIAVIVVKY
jgi:hypothetical protein